MLINGYAFPVIFIIENSDVKNQLKSSKNMFFKQFIEYFRKDISNEEFRIKAVIDPILNDFKDNNGRKCLAINMGYSQ